LLLSHRQRLAPRDPSAVCGEVMTAKKETPSKRGRKQLGRGIREMVYLRFRSFFRDEKRSAPERLKRDIAVGFVSKNQAWFASIGVAIGNYETLRNVLVEGRKERTARRRQNWGIVTNITGQRLLTTNAAYVRHVQAGGRGLA
jgi:hypothetical protein